MDHDDLLTKIQKHGRLYGRGESRRVLSAVLVSLSESLPAPAYRRLHAALPADVRQRLPRPGAGRLATVTGARAFLARVGGRLHVDGPDAAFLARVVFGQLNAAGYAPSKLAPLVPADLRPLMQARPAGLAAAAPAPRRLIVNPCRKIPGVRRKTVT